jgi:cation diffusion facilitator CzcD-associated flavoprotein CzcO
VAKIPRTIIIVSGAGGISFAMQVKRLLPEAFEKPQIFERNSAHGGTWFINHYPGVAYDIPAHLYTFPSEPYPTWSTGYAAGEEIRRYFDFVFTKYEMDKIITYDTLVKKYVWREDFATWSVTVQSNGKESVHEAEFVVAAHGH